MSSATSMASPLVNRAVLEIMKDHRYVRQVEANELSEFETFPVISRLSQMDLGPAHIDVGRLAVNYYDHGAGAEGLSIEEYIDRELESLAGNRGQATGDSHRTWCSMVLAVLAA